MKKTKMLTTASAVAASLGLAFTGCADSATTPYDGPSMEIAVAPLTLPGIDVACYDVEVVGAEGTVWSAGVTTDTADGGDTGALCSDQYGNGAGGDISYVGPCDASAAADTDGAQAGVQNTVTLWVDGLYSGSSAGGLTPIEADGTSGWQDPCVGGCTLQIDCNENEDTFVEFNLTIMRDANQGFFDIAVNFEDIFCSAKFDSCYADDGDDTTDESIVLLHGQDGVRGRTSIAAFACTAGPDGATDVTTQLMMSKVFVKCGQDSAVLNLAGQAAGNHTFELPAGTLVSYALYFGDEQLQCDGEDCNKSYLNVAINTDELPNGGDGCVFGAQATAQDANNPSLNGGVFDAVGSSYPAIQFGPIKLSSSECTRNSLNGDGSGVQTIYANDFVDDPTKMFAMCVGYTAGSGVLTATTNVDSITDAKGNHDSKAYAQNMNNADFGRMEGTAALLRDACTGNVQTKFEKANWTQTTYEPAITATSVSIPTVTNLEDTTAIGEESTANLANEILWGFGVEGMNDEGGWESRILFKNWTVAAMTKTSIELDEGQLFTVHKVYLANTVQSGDKATLWRNNLQSAGAFTHGFTLKTTPTFQ